jgi:tRNA1(Val) A37 N6-methylase TrmN6
VGYRNDDSLNAYDQVFSNPPFFEPNKIQTVSEGKRAAFLADVSLEDWLKFMLHCVKPKGTITLIHRAAALSDILSFMNSRFGEIQVLPVRAYSGAKAKRVIVTGRKGLRKGETVLHDGLTLYQGQDRYLTARAADILAGGKLNWS